MLPFSSDIFDKQFFAYINKYVTCKPVNNYEFTDYEYALKLAHLKAHL